MFEGMHRLDAAGLATRHVRSARSVSGRGLILVKKTTGPRDVSSMSRGPDHLLFNLRAPHVGDHCHLYRTKAMIWTGRVMSGVVILFLLFDGAIASSPASTW